MVPQVKISDIAIWIKHVESPQLRERLKALPDESLSIWKRMALSAAGFG